MTIGPLPEFLNPPVSEVALSVSFEPLPGWSAAHGGLFWSQIRKAYPITETHPVLISPIENLDTDDLWANQAVTIQNIGPDLVRQWFLSEDRTRIIQVQRDRFIVNWRRVSGTEEYPRYQNVMRPRFENEWSEFCKFIESNNFGSAEVRQCEIVYVNDIFQGADWAMFADALELFSPWWKRGSDGFLPSPTTLSVNALFAIPKKHGRLYVDGRHVRRVEPNKEAFQLQLTARGRSSSSSAPDILSWMDYSREWIVRAFADLTSPTAHRKWGRSQ